MSRRSGWLPAVLTLITVITVGACSTPAASSIPPGATGAVASFATATPPPSAATATFPITLTDDEGTAVEIAAEPDSIISLTPAVTETLFALEAGDRVVATDDSSDFPESAVALPDVATFGSVDVESIVALEPDLVIAGGLGFNPPESIAQLRDLGIPVLVVYAPSVEGVYDDIELIGQAVGQADEATSITESMRTEIDAIHAAIAAAGTPPRVFYDVGYDDGTGQIFAPADDSFVAEMVTLAGGDTITSGDPSTYEIPLERLIEQDPEIIVLGTNAFYQPTPQAVADRTGWKALTAVKNGDIRPVHDIEITRPGPRLATGLRNLATAIWPDVTLPGPSS